ncbi:MAG: DUF5597 domain-containing protein [Verrucomicrobiota bacterium]|jgi:hypothetical protein
MKIEIGKRSCGRLCAAALASLGLALLSDQTPVMAANPMPQVVTTNGHHALFVDGAPYLMLGAQSHNSSAWPGTLPKVWAAMDDLHANTLEIPVYWEQFEPQPGQFDPSIVDLMIQGAREHNLRLVFLWFGTWKNGSGHYIPLWAKSHPDMFTHITGSRGRHVDSPSPLAEACMKADMNAFSALMRHIKSVDPVHTVIMIQVENEPGAWGSIRDYSPEAEKVFAAPVPAEFLKALAGRNGAKGDSGNWREVFGDNADEYFHAYCVAHYIGQVAAAGKAEYPLPMYVNAALRDPLTNPRAGSYESGGATDNVLDIWKAAAPAIDILCPDIYQNDTAKYLAVLDHYSRPDNTLFVPETGGTGNASRMCFAALGRGAVGWSPFGLDYTRATPESLTAVGMNYRMLEPIMREVAQLNFEGKVKAIEEEAGQSGATLDFGAWSAVINFTGAGGGRGRRGGGAPPDMAAPAGARAGRGARGATAEGGEAAPPAPTGRALVAQISENQFYLTGSSCTIEFKAANGGQRDWLRVEEAEQLERKPNASHDGRDYSPASAFRVMRILNGDETDHALPFSTAPEAVRVTLGTY